MQVSESRRLRVALAVLVVATGMVGLSSGPATPVATAAGSSCSGMHWVRAWGAAPGSASEQIFAEQTIRTVLTPLTAGSTARVRLSNRYGSAPVTFGSVTLGKAAAGASLVPGSNRAVRFRGARSVTVPAGSERVSDPVKITVRPFENLTVGVYVKGVSGPATSHGTGRQTSYLSMLGAGDVTGGSASKFTSTTTSRYFVAGVDVRRSRRVGTVVTFGDSITDGYQGVGVPVVENTAGMDRPVRYPDFLARRIDASSRAFGVANSGISGNRVVSPGFEPGMGPSAVSRYRADVLAVPGVTDVIVMEGTNDLGMSPDPVAEAPKVIAGLRRIVTDLRGHGLRVLVGTIPPAGGVLIPTYGGSAHQRARAMVNRWIRTSGVPSAVVDFDKVLRDPAEPTRLLPIYDSSDHLHPNSAGYQAMAAAVPLRLLRGPRCGA
jgi:lysophospholipase L1-like esterase